jgi:hypothetical protein
LALTDAGVEMLEKISVLEEGAADCLTEGAAPMSYRFFRIAAIMTANVIDHETGSHGSHKHE